MKLLGIDYRSVLGEERLKSFVRRTGAAAGYRLVEHPSQKAKVGIVPANAAFNFPASVPIDTHHNIKSNEPARPERTVIAFLRILSRLPNEDQDAVVIPIRVLTKLLELR